jgi:putative ABC transport system substrate-binding protein
LGWIPGRNLQIDYRWGMGEVEKARAATVDLLKLTPSVLIAVASPATAAMQQTTRTVPIVFVAVSEPVTQGFVASLAHPGANLTGFTHLEPTLGAKWLDLLKEIAPNLSRAALMFNAATPQAALFLRSVEAAAPQFAVKAVAAPVHGLEEVEAVITRLATLGGLLGRAINTSSFRVGPLFCRCGRRSSLCSRNLSLLNEIAQCPKRERSISRAYALRRYVRGTTFRQFGPRC